MKKRLLCAMLALLLLMPLVASLPFTVDAAERTYDGVNVVHHEGSYDHLDRNMTVYRYDFNVSRLSYYVADSALAISDRTKIIVDDGVLTAQPGSAVAFGSAVCLGDDYGLEDGYLQFDLCRTGGSVTLGLRTARKAVSPDEGRGIWVTFDGSNNLTVKDFLTETTVSIPFSQSLDSAKTFRVEEKRDVIEVYCEGQLLFSVKWKTGWLGFYGADGTELAQTDQSKLDCTGYWELYMDNFEGYVDNILFSHMEIDDSLPDSDQKRTVDYSTWSAIDDLGRETADATTASASNSNRYVGLFYFLCWTGAGQHAINNTELYQTLGDQEFKAYFNAGKGGEHYWAEPYFGYYLNTDAWVYRKHAYMLEAAGVDFIFLDVSNKETFVNGHLTLFDTWLQIRREGGDTPQIVFFNGDDSDTFASNMNTLFTTVYSEDNWDKYKELFFEWEGKPLVFGNKSGLSSSMQKKIESVFTIRGSWAWNDQDGYWPWMVEYVTDSNGQPSIQNGGWGRSPEGDLESLVVCMGYHPASNKGRSFVNGKQPSSTRRADFGFSMTEQAAKGEGFAASFSAMQTLVNENVDSDTPFVMMITGWNEWIAGCGTRTNRENFINVKTKWYYVDQFNCEYSRDGEPMRNINGEGLGDNFYYQMTDYIRKFKGVSTTAVADNQKTVDIYDRTTWDAISLTYMDQIGDAELRNTASYDIDYRYINNTGRNDFDYAKVSQDSKYLYFMAVCNHDIVVDDGTTWMNLFLDIDGDRQNGWGGYDYVLNRDRDSYVVTVERIAEDGTTEVVGGAYYCIDGSYMAIRVEKAVLGIDGNCEHFYFKWADNAVDVGGDLMAFMDTGDCAPNDRYSFDYRCESVDNYDTSYTLPTFTKTIVAATGNGGVRTEDIYPDTNVGGEPILTEVTQVYTFDGEGYSAGKYLKDTALGEVFEYIGATATSSAQIKKENGNNYVQQKGMTDLRTYTDVTGPYTFSIDLRPKEYGNNAVYIRGEMPGALRKYNGRHSVLANQEVIQVFNYYEWDWYQENGGKSGSSSISGSGLGLFPMQNGIEVHLKRYAEDGLTVTSSVATLTFPSDFSVDANGFYNLCCKDDGELIEIFVNQVLLATVRLSDPNAVYESDGTGQKYYGHATLCDAEGTVLLDVDNTRLNAVGSQIAVTTREQVIEYDNLTISRLEENDPIGSRLEKKYVSADGTPAYTPDTHLLTALMPENGTVAPNTEQTDATETQPNNSNNGCGGCGSTLTGMTFVFALGLGFGAIAIARKKKD